MKDYDEVEQNVEQLENELEEVEEELEQKEEGFLECERWRCFLLLITVGGFFGAYTFSVKGGVFCNAQTANIVLFGMALGNMDWSRAAYLLIPISSYFIGTMVSEYLALKIKKYRKLRWDTILIGIEIITVIILGLLPSSVPDQVFQVTINFICAMQFNTFRQAEKVGMATTFVTNHIRQTGSFFVRWLRKRHEKKYLNRSLRHLCMILCFVAGAIFSTVLTNFSLLSFLTLLLFVLQIPFIYTLSGITLFVFPPFIAVAPIIAFSSIGTSIFANSFNAIPILFAI